jgi:hypothetical protein
MVKGDVGMSVSSVQARPEPKAADAKQGTVINCAAYHGGRRVADIDLDQARKIDISDGRFARAERARAPNASTITPREGSNLEFAEASHRRRTSIDPG